MHECLFCNISRINVTANHVIREDEIPAAPALEQLDLFADHKAEERKRAADEAENAKEKRLQNALLDIKKKLGKNAILKGMNLLDGAIARQRNEQLGGHRK